MTKKTLKETKTKTKIKPSKTKTSKKNKSTPSIKSKKSASTPKKIKKTTKVPSYKLTPEKKKIKQSNIDRDEQLVQIIIEGMQEKKAQNISVLNLKKIENSFCNYFVICEAESKPQLQSITESVQEFTQKKLNLKPHHTEGIQNAEWILLDYLTVIVHIFRSDVRNFYNIEALWADAEIKSIH